MLKKILLGFHDNGNLISLARLSKAYGYVADTTSNLSEMVKLARENNHDLYLMDINLGEPGSTNIRPMEEVYDLVSQRVKSGLAKIMGLSANEDTVKIAKSKNLPVEYKLRFNSEEFFRD